MTFKILYIAAVPLAGFVEYADRFVSGYLKYPPGYDHKLVVIVNGAEIDDRIRFIFSPTGCEFYQGDNIGFDTGSYISYAKEFQDADAFVCCGTQINFTRSGWLKRYSEAWDAYGPNYYGALPNVRPAIRTLGFCIPPSFLRSYPNPVITRQERRNFEDMHMNMMWYAMHIGHKTYLVTWSGIYEIPVQNDHYWNGDNNDLLFNDIRFYRHDPEIGSLDVPV